MLVEFWAEGCSSVCQPEAAFEEGEILAVWIEKSAQV